MSRLTALRCLAAVVCAILLVGVVPYGFLLMLRYGLSPGERRALFVLASAGGLAALGGLILTWRARQRGLLALAEVQRHVGAVEAARDELERLLNGLPVAVYVGSLRPDGRQGVRYLASGIARVTGWPAERIPDHAAFLALVPEEDRQLAAEHFDHVALNGEATAEYRLSRPDGSAGWIRQKTRVLTTTAAETELIGTLSDVTAEHALAERIAVNEARFRGFLEASPDAIIISDVSGRIVVASQRVEALFGYAPEELAGRPHSILVPERHRAAHDVHMRGYFNAPRVRPMGVGRTYALRRDGSEFPTEISLSPYRDLEGLFVITAVRDITQRQQVEDELRQAQKMEAVGQLTGGIAHDFNNLLTTILGNTELLEWGDRRFDAETAALIAAIRRAGERASSLTRQLLAFSRKQPLTPEVADLNRLVRRMSDMLRRTLGEPIKVEVVLAAGLWSVHIDTNQFENAVLNLAINARDAMPEGGKLTIETCNASLDEDYASAHSEVRPGQYVMVAVTDTGTGMNDETLRRAFEPFYTTKPVGQGTGLGLSQVYGFVKQMGGHIKLYSEPGSGSTVRIYLPRHLAAGEPALSPTDPTRNMALLYGVETVLVVEDEDTVRDFAAEALMRLGYHILVADNAAAALAILRREPNVALLFTDVGLPGANGRQLANEAVVLHPDLKVLFTTGYARNAIVHNGILDPGVHLLSKPYTIEGLGRRVREILDHD